MAIRIRKVGNTTIAIDARKSNHNDGDIFLNDEQVYAIYLKIYQKDDDLNLVEYCLMQLAEEEKR
jgi:hypothetical protein